MTRGRINVASYVPESGATKVTANMIVLWDDGTSLADQEHAIKEAAKAALARVREINAGTGRPASRVTTGRL